MTLYQRRESAGRTRFLLALSLSTLTALGVAAPLALQAVNADETLALNDPVAGAHDESGDDDLLGSPGARSLSNDSDSNLGGITQRPAVKGQGQTSKTDTEPAAPATSPSTDNPALTNPDTTPTTAAEVEPVETTAEPATTTITAPTDESSSTTASTTTSSSSTTDTTDPDSTTSSSSSTTVGSSSTTDPSTTTTETSG